MSQLSFVDGLSVVKPSMNKTRHEYSKKHPIRLFVTQFVDGSFNLRQRFLCVLQIIWNAQAPENLEGAAG